MTDLVERMRNDQVVQTHASGADTLCIEAADRIETLEAALKPFADLADQIAAVERQVGDKPSPDHMLRLVPMRLLRNAYAALNPNNGGDE